MGFEGGDAEGQVGELVWKLGGEGGGAGLRGFGEGLAGIWCRTHCTYFTADGFGAANVLAGVRGSCYLR